MKNKIEIAKQSNAHRQELQAIETELALAQKELDGSLHTKEVTDDDKYSADATIVEDFHSNTVTKNVLTLLQKQDAVSLSNFPATYEDEFGSAFAKDADECMSPECKKRRKLKEILQSMPFCEVVNTAG